MRNEVGVRARERVKLGERRTDWRSGRGKRRLWRGGGGI